MMINKQIFFEEIRTSLFSGKISVAQVEGIEAILDEGKDLTEEQMAYVLATVYHETAQTFRAIEEYGKGKGRKYGSKLKLSGQPYTTPNKIYYGRGFVQLTWYENYEKLGKILGLDLLNNPELNLTNSVAAKIAIIGMTKGIFTGKKLSDYFNDKIEDSVNARRIINILDKATLISSYYKKFIDALK